MHFRSIAFIAALLFFSDLAAQPGDFRVTKMRLPAAIADPNNQISGLYIYDDLLYFLTECRLQDGAPARLFTVALADLDRQQRDTGYVLPFSVVPVINLDILRFKIKNAGPDYEGLEAMIIHNGRVYFSVETATPSDDCFILEGDLRDGRVVMDTEHWRLMPKPLMAGNKKVYNAGFESLALIGRKLYSFFEYNYDSTTVRPFWEGAPMNRGTAHYQRVPGLPFRLTDVTRTDEELVGINYFFRGEGSEEVYRVPVTDTSYRFTRSGNAFSSYTRLVTIDPRNGFSWQPLWEFPPEYFGYNWEGICAYKGGFFVINDKYTPARPYATTLLYLENTGSARRAPAKP